LVTFLEEKIEYKGLILRKIREGSTELFVPDPESYVPRKNYYLPAALPVFYNPLMEINRDITIALIKTYLSMFAKENDLIYVEALAGTGIRGFRILNEIEDNNVMVILNDLNPKAIDLMQFNLEILNFPENKLKIYNLDANYLFLKLRRNKIIPSIIEIDPYGTPIPFIFNAIKALTGKNGLLIVTATDTAPLTGKFPNAALRKYGCRIIKNPFSREVAVRALIYTIGREASILSKRGIPLFAVFLHHFIKVAILFTRGKKHANEFWKSIGWVSFCPICNEFYIASGLHNFPMLYCEEKEHGSTEVLGPLWINSLFDKNFSDKMLDVLGKVKINKKNSELLKKIISQEMSAADLPLFYDVHEISRRLGKSAPKTDSVVNELINHGFRASRTHFNPRGVKTNARLRDIIEILNKI